MQIGVAWAMTLIFIVLKLTGYIDWAWVFVFAPLWIGVVFILCLIILAATFGIIRKRDRGTD